MATDEKSIRDTVRATQTTPPTTTPAPPKDSPAATVAPGHTPGKTEETKIDFGAGAVSPEDMAQFQRDAQTLPADKVKVPGTNITLAELKKRRKEADQKAAPVLRRHADANALHETSAVAPKEVRVGVAADGTIITTPVSLSPDEIRKGGKDMAAAVLSEPEDQEMAAALTTLPTTAIDTGDTTKSPE